MQLELDIKKSVEQNAELYYHRVKKAKKKLEGLKKALDKFRQELHEIKKKKSELFEKERKKEEIKPKLKKKWYEGFHWFISSEGILCVGGRDATTNDIIIKKYMEDTDNVFHTEAPGSPFFLVKSEGKEVSEQTLQEAAQATATFSKAWKLGISVVDVYWVKPAQVSKKAKSGEYLSKGAFMIYEKKNMYRVELSLAVGALIDGSIMSGPVTAVKKNCAKYVVVHQGKNKASDCAKKIQKQIGGDLDEILRSLPGGDCSIV
ncbi:DUF814 domain-containing protein [Candidatus Woesearchaeota archaeon]|nr:DUF814 domain-containing protein [Candidatus Woesearchaeota archaeon]